MTAMTDSSRKNFLAALALLLFTFAAGANAQSAADAPLASQDAEFLPVDETYLQDFMFSRQGVSAIFQIALGYYLYRDKVTLSVFAVLGAGMATPFLLLTYIPSLADRLPHPGPWMDRLKQLLAFPIYLTAVWLLWVLGRQTGSDGVALAFALWLWPRPDWHWGRGVVAVTALATAALLPPQLPATDGEPETASYWRAYSPERLASARAEGRPLLANMTAAWCITCLANDKMVLASEEIADAVRELDVVTLKGDWTNQDPQISELLARYGRTSVPLYLLYSADGGEAKILPQVLTREGLLAELRAAARPALRASTE